MDVRSDIFPGTPEGFHLRDVSVRLARPDERIRWDRLMDQHHYLGFKRFAGVAAILIRFKRSVSNGDRRHREGFGQAARSVHISQ